MPPSTEKRVPFPGRPIAPPSPRMQALRLLLGEVPSPAPEPAPAPKKRAAAKKKPRTAKKAKRK